MDHQHIYYLSFPTLFGLQINYLPLKISTYIGLLATALKFNGLLLKDTNKEFDILAFNAP
jgi:hypothetical protein